MKLKNKKTGEIGTLVVDGAYKFVTNFAVEDDEMNRLGEYNSLAELCEEWEDYEEEEKEYYALNSSGQIWTTECFSEESIKNMKSIGNYFETQEEAEKAVERLRAWKRLKDKGFRPKMWEWEYIYDDNISGELIIKAHIDDATDSNGKYTKDLDLLFGGEE